MPFEEFDEPKTRPLDAAILSQMWERMRPYKRAIYANLGISIAIVVLELLPPRLTEHIINVNIAQGDKTGLALSIGGLLAMVGAIMVLWRIQIRRVVTIGERVVFNLRQEIFDHLQALSMSYYDKMKAGRIIARGTSDLAAMRNTIVWGLPRIVLASLILVGTLIMMYVLDGRLFKAMLIVVPLLAMANWWFRRRITVAWRNVREIQSRIVSTLAENINGVRVIQAYARESKNLEHFQDLQSESVARHMTAAKVAGIYMPSLSFIGAIGKAIILVYGGYLVYQGAVTQSDDALKIGTLVGFLMYQELLFAPIHEMGDVYNEALHAMAGGERIFTLLGEVPAVQDRPGAEPMPRITGHVKFENVTFGYNPEHPVLHEVDFEALPGQTFALVGPTGAGKSSIVKLIPRFYDIQQGKITIDGIDVRDVTMESLHRQMGIVSQMNFMFSGPLLDNIRYSRPEAEREEVIEAAKALGSHDIFAKLPDGYDTEVSERGESLSLGQRQLVCFTRAMLANPRIFILDEATSSVDPQTEIRIQIALRRLLEGRTSFVIAHRLSTIRDADQVLFIDGGRVVERGNHHELMALGGRYHQLYEEFIRTT
jgi:ATP-binding cassette subfamily B protein